MSIRFLIFIDYNMISLLLRWHNSDIAIITTNGHIVWKLSYSEWTQTWFLNSFFITYNQECKTIAEWILYMNDILLDFVNTLWYNKSDKDFADEAYSMALVIKDNKKLSINEKYHNIIGLYQWKEPLDYYDPDSSYEDDINAYIEALKEKSQE